MVTKKLIKLYTPFAFLCVAREFLLYCARIYFKKNKNQTQKENTKPQLKYHLPLKLASVIAKEHWGPAVLLTDALLVCTSSTWLCLMPYCSYKSVLINTVSWSVVSYWLIVAMPMTIVKHSYFSVHWKEMGRETRTSRTLSIIFSLQTWEISWTQTREKQWLKDKLQFSTSCTYSATQDHKWHGLETGTRLYQAAECKSLQSSEYPHPKVWLITFDNATYILSTLIKV